MYFKCRQHCTVHFKGLTENAGRENDGPSKLQSMKLQDMKLQDMKLQDRKLPDMKMQDMKKYTFNYSELCKFLNPQH